ncbi:MAG: 5'/3'-nucleotidase SurE [Dehalococcoidia bacterium]
MTRNVLVTNDDGIESPGLWALAEAVRPFAGGVYVVAPSTNQSAVGAGMTMNRELRWEELDDPPVEGVRAWHVNGTPGDCVMIGLRQIVDRWITVVLSGVNAGANLGNDVLASGTVGGAFQGHFRGLTSMAFSQALIQGRDHDWSGTAAVAQDIFEATLTDSPVGNVFLNVNIPAIPYHEIKGTLVTRMGRSGYLQLTEVAKDRAVVEREMDLPTHPKAPPGTDVWAILHGFVSVSPMHSNLTDHRLLDSLAERLNSPAGQRTKP